MTGVTDVGCDNNATLDEVMSSANSCRPDCMACDCTTVCTDETGCGTVSGVGTLEECTLKWATKGSVGLSTNDVESAVCANLLSEVSSGVGCATG